MKKLLVTAMAVAALSGGMVAEASAAPATEGAQADTIAACNYWNIGNPGKVGSSTVRASYSFCSNYAAGFKTEIQRSRWYGWETVAKREFRAVAGRAYGESYDGKCEDTHTYRQLSQAQNAAGTWQTKYSGEVRFGC